MRIVWILVFPQSFPLGLEMPFVVEGPSDVRHSAAGLGKVEDALDDARGIRVGLQGGALLRPVPHHHPRDLLGEDIGYSINTKNQVHMGGWA